MAKSNSPLLNIHPSSPARIRQAGAIGFVYLLLITLTQLGCTNDNGEIGNYRYRTDMQEQPSFKKLEDPLPPVKNTVPVRGYKMPLRDSVSAAHLVNPAKWTSENADSGKFLFETHCSPCHGLGAKGDGPVAAKFQQPPDLTAGKYQKTPGGYIYYVIRNGHLIMPSYYESVKSRERWLIVNHIRSLQK